MKKNIIFVNNKKYYSSYKVDFENLFDKTSINQLVITDKGLITTKLAYKLDCCDIDNITPGIGTLLELQDGKLYLDVKWVNELINPFDDVKNRDLRFIFDRDLFFIDNNRHLNLLYNTTNFIVDTSLKINRYNDVIFNQPIMNFQLSKNSNRNKNKIVEFPANSILDLKPLTKILIDNKLPTCDCKNNHDSIILLNNQNNPLNYDIGILNEIKGIETKNKQITTVNKCIYSSISRLKTQLNKLKSHHNSKSTDKHILKMLILLNTTQKIKQKKSFIDLTNVINSLILGYSPGMYSNNLTITNDISLFFFNNVLFMYKSTLLNNEKILLKFDKSFGDMGKFQFWDQDSIASPTIDCFKNLTFSLKTEDTHSDSASHSSSDSSPQSALNLAPQTTSNSAPYSSSNSAPQSALNLAPQTTSNSASYSSSNSALQSTSNSASYSSSNSAPQSASNSASQTTSNSASQTKTESKTTTNKHMLNSCNSMWSIVGYFPNSVPKTRLEWATLQDNNGNPKSIVILGDIIGWAEISMSNNNISM
jgi:hypothetical protein